MTLSVDKISTIMQNFVCFNSKTTKLITVKLGMNNYQPEESVELVIS